MTRTDSSGRGVALRWLDATFCVIFILGAMFIGFGLLFGPAEWHSAPSMHLVHQLHIPWTVWGYLFLLYGLLLARHETRVIGYFVGFVLYAFYATSFVVVTTQGIETKLGNLVFLVLGVNGAAQQAAAGVRAMILNSKRYQSNLNMQKAAYE